MHPFRSENIDGSGERRGHRRHENRKASVHQFFDNEGGDESFLNLGQRGLPNVLLITLPRQSLRQTSKECIAGHSFEERFLDALLERRPGRWGKGSAKEKEDNQHEKKRKNVLRG